MVFPAKIDEVVGYSTFSVLSNVLFFFCALAFLVFFIRCYYNVYIVDFNNFEYNFSQSLFDVYIYIVFARHKHTKMIIMIFMIPKAIDTSFRCYCKKVICFGIFVCIVDRGIVGAPNQIVLL